MSKQIKDFDALTSNASDYLQSKLGFSAWTIRHHTTNWNQLKKFMISNGIERYTLNVERKILYRKFKDRNMNDLSRTEKEFYNSMKMLSEFQTTGKIRIYPRMVRREFIVTGKIGEAINRFLNHKKVADRLSIVRLHCSKKVPIGMVISTLRGFIKYAYKQKLLDQDFSTKIPKYRSVSQPKLPSTYSKEEVEKLIASVERSSTIGKRNYAIVLMAAKLGLRASDISRLKFDDLHWNASTIEITQHKTGKALILPLLADVGNSIIEYLKYARPRSEAPYVFLTERPPYGHFTTSNVVTHVIQRTFQKSGIDTKGRRFGPHSLRHSLGFRMLQESTILPVISEVLGHENTESTRYYLRVDLQSMQQCMLDVPPVTDSFYTQNEGVFYE